MIRKDAEAMASKRRGRPRLHDQNKLEFFLFFTKLKCALTLVNGQGPSDSEMFEFVAANGGYEHWVAGDWEEIQEAQKDPKVSPQVARMRWGTRCVRSKMMAYPKTLRNYYGICMKEAENDPTFMPFAEKILAVYGICSARPEEGKGHCSGWMPARNFDLPN
jgi:hypothetical protein